MGNKREFSETRLATFALYHFPAHMHQTNAPTMYFSGGVWQHLM